MKILHVTEVFDGGVAAYVRELVSTQKKLFGSDSVGVLLPKGEGLAGEGGPLDASFSRRSRSAGAVFGMLVKVWHLVRAEKPDVVHAHSTFAGLVCRLPCVCPGARVIYTPHSWAFSMDVSWVLKSVYVVFERLLAKNTDVLLAVSASEALLAKSNDIRPRLVRTVCTGIPDRPVVNRSLDAQDRSVVLLMAARFAPQKLHDDLIQALSQLACKNWEMWFAGDGEHRARSEALVGKLGLQDRVSFLGVRSDVPELLDQADVFVMPSMYEGLPISILEAMRAGLPVVVNNVDGNAEAVADCETGFLLDVGDIDALAARLDLLIASPEKRLQMGQKGRVRYEQLFAASRMNEQVVQAYRDALA